MSRIPARHHRCSAFTHPSACLSPKSWLALCVRAAVFGGAFGMATLAPHALAQSGEAVLKVFNVPAGTLDDALHRFARQGGITLVFDPALVRGRSAAALHGSVSVRDGLATLLAPNDLQAVQAADGSYLVQPVAGAGEAVLRPVSVEGRIDKEKAGGPVLDRKSVV